MPVTQTTKANAITVKNLKLPYLFFEFIQFTILLQSVSDSHSSSHLVYIANKNYVQSVCASAIRCDDSLLRHGDHSL